MATVRYTHNSTFLETNTVEYENINHGSPKFSEVAIELSQLVLYDR